MVFVLPADTDESKTETVLSWKSSMPPIFVSCFKFVVFSFVTMTTVSTVGNLLKKEIRYRAHQIDNFDATFCASDTPSKVPTSGSISKARCVLLCLDDARCRGVNWKEPSTCEMYFFDPTLSDASSRCSVQVRFDEIVLI